ncbi:nuclear transport factor 2 family protein [uncultured Pontibacter sp.]|uniref:YybH family protein n=1 Tax=uncultured Pontibacter sp. TaxID=453356 RepID=UPI00261AC144|nr:nuclear transport factor 2 family protein [uncultured Pontibacter sp.]
MKRYLYILFFAATLSSCTQQEEAVNVQSLNQEFISAWNSDNPDKVISYLAEDVQFIQGETHFTGKTEVANKWVKDTYTTISDLKTNVVSTGTDGTMAYEAGTFSVDVLPTGQEQLRGIGEGNFILLWKKNTEGDWKLSYAQLEGLPVQLKN